MRDAGLPTHGLVCVLESSVPVGAGLSSSAALELASGKLLGGVTIEGSAISFADLAVYAYVATAAHLGLELEERYPNLHAFCLRMKERPSVIATWPSLLALQRRAQL